MIKYHELKILIPCYIDFNKLPYDEISRNCNKCERQVYDFRNKDEKYFNKIWKQNHENICGIFKYNQFNKTNSTKPNSFIKKVATRLTGFVLLTFTTLKAYTQTDKQISIKIENTKGNITHTTLSLYINNNHIEYFIVNDSSFTTIILPDSVKPTDLITVKKEKYKNNDGWSKTIIKK